MKRRYWIGSILAGAWAILALLPPAKDLEVIEGERRPEAFNPRLLSSAPASAVALRNETGEFATHAVMDRGRFDTSAGPSFASFDDSPASRKSRRLRDDGAPLSVTRTTLDGRDQGGEGKGTWYGTLGRVPFALPFRAAAEGGEWVPPREETAPEEERGDRASEIGDPEPLDSPFDYDLKRFRFGNGLTPDRRGTSDFSSQVAAPPDTRIDDVESYPDRTFSLGHGGWVEIEVRDGAVIDRRGPDLFVHAAAGSWGAAAVSVDPDGRGVFRPLATISTGGNPQFSLDLALAGIREARVIRIQDADPRSEKEVAAVLGKYAGFDLDAVALVHAFKTERKKGELKS